MLSLSLGCMGLQRVLAGLRLSARVVALYLKILRSSSRSCQVLALCKSSTGAETAD